MTLGLSLPITAKTVINSVNGDLFKCSCLTISEIIQEKRSYVQLVMPYRTMDGRQKQKWKGWYAWNWQWSAERLVIELWPVSRLHQSQRNGRLKCWIKHQTTWLWHWATENSRGCHSHVWTFNFGLFWTFQGFFFFFSLSSLFHFLPLCDCLPGPIVFHIRPVND